METRIRGAHRFARLLTLHFFLGLQTAEFSRASADGHDSESRRTSSSIIGRYGTEGVRAVVEFRTKPCEQHKQSDFTRQTPQC